MRNIHGSLSFGLFYKRAENLVPDIYGFSDADWSGKREKRKSTSGNIFQMHSGTVSWMGRKQTCNALSSTEAEHIALSDCGKKARWIRQILCEWRYGFANPAVIYEDITRAISWACKQKWTKHIEIKYHSVQELVEREIICLQYCPTKHMIADVMTTAFSQAGFEYLRKCLGVVSFGKEGNDGSAK